MAGARLPRGVFGCGGGAGTGGLAAHVLDFAARAIPDFYQALRYVAVEQSPARRHAHAERLEAHISRGRAISAAELPREIPEGCILSNELFDALPAHRVLCKNGALREMFVGLRATARKMTLRKASLAAPGDPRN